MLQSILFVNVFFFSVSLTPFFPCRLTNRNDFVFWCLGTTSLAICFPEQAVDITLTNYNRLKVFMKEKRTNFSQKRAENPFAKAVHSPFSCKTVNLEGEQELVKVVV